MLQLHDTFGNPSGVERAIEKATPNRDKIKERLRRIQKLDSDLVGVERSRNSILTLVERDSISLEQAQKKLDEIKQRGELLIAERDQIASSLDDVPTSERIKAVARTVAKQFRGRRYGSAKRRALQREANQFENMTWEDKRSLVELVFEGMTDDGRPLGVYISPLEGQIAHRSKRWAFTIRGVTPAEELQCVTQCAFH